MRTPIIAAAAVCIAAVLGAAVHLSLRPAAEHSSPALLNAAGADIGGSFELTTHRGRRVGSAELIDRPTLIYFGYTFCPDVCPVDAAVMADAARILAERGLDVQPVFVTVDPERDTPEAMTYFVEALHPGMIGLTGSADEIRAAADAFKVYYSRQEMPDSAAEYLMNHTAYTYLLAPGERLLGIFRNGFPPERIAADVEALLDAL